jgi:alkylated DNA repair dioxygenase AlkB
METDFFLKPSKGSTSNMHARELQAVPGTFGLVLRGRWPAPIPRMEAFNDVQWQQKLICGQLVPRQQAFYTFGDNKLTRYKFGGSALVRGAFVPEAVLAAGQVASQLASCEFNAAVLNLYVGDRSSVAWHSDDEPECTRDSEGRVKTIVSLSLGESRVFQLRPKFPSQVRRSSDIVSIQLEDGDVLLMLPGCQEAFEHRVPKKSGARASKSRRLEFDTRLNCTFRMMGDHGSECCAAAVAEVHARGLAK